MNQTARSISSFRHVHAPKWLPVLLAVLCLGMLNLPGTGFRLTGELQASELVLKNGTILEGKSTPITSLVTGPKGASTLPTTVYSIVMVQNDLQRYFVSVRNVEKINHEGGLSKFEVFNLFQQPRSRTKTISTVGGFVEVKPFDQFGRRTVTLSTSTGPMEVIQGITKITPQMAKVQGLTHFWETGIATSSIPVENLDMMLRSAIKADNSDHRLAVARFYLQAGLFKNAQKELEDIRAQFPELAESVTEVNRELYQIQARQLLDELKLRQSAGQHTLVYQTLKTFPTEQVDPALLREVRELIKKYDKQREQLESARVILGELQAGLKSETQVTEVAPLRTEIGSKLHLDSLSRLDAFFKLSEDRSLPASDKLALALSGWVVGSNNAVTDLDTAIRLWKMRFHVVNYLRTAHDAENERKQIALELSQIEGVSPQRISQMLPLLPPIIESVEIEPGVPSTISMRIPGEKVPLEYMVVLPKEYHPDRTWPLIVALHGVGKRPDQELGFWAGSPQNPAQAQRHGYIVIAPKYMKDGEKMYDYGLAAHQIVQEAIRDARLRFNVDSDRVFISGHGAGGEAAFDISMSHPDQFAGVIPMGAIADRFSKVYFLNAKDIPFYVLDGDLNGENVVKNANLYTKMMENRLDMIYTEFIGFGMDSYYAEIHKLFAWMSRCRRPKIPKEINVKTLRHTDNRFYWLQVEGLPTTLNQVDWGGKGRIVPVPLVTKITPGNTLVLPPGAKSFTIWISPDVVDFEKRFVVTMNGKTKFNEFVKPDIGSMLEDLRQRGDRQMSFWAMLSF